MHFVQTPANSKTRSKQCKNVVSLLIDLPRKSKKNVDRLDTTPNGFMLG